MFHSFTNVLHLTIARLCRKLRSRKSLAVVLCGLMIAGMLSQVQALAAEDIWNLVEPNRLHNITVGTLNRQFYVHVPNGYEYRRALPLLILFHGGSGNALAIANKTHMDQVADSNRFIAVYPQAIDKHWNDGRVLPHRPDVDDVAFVKAMIARLEEKLNIDTTRIYVAGFSDGGWFTQRLTFEMHSTIAGAAMVCSPETTTLVQMFGSGHQPLPVLYMLGTSDPRMPWFGGPVTASTVLSADATVNAWLLADNCQPIPRIYHVPNRDPFDGSHVELSYYTGTGGNDVAFYKIIGGGHSWPGGTPSPASEGNTNEDLDGSQHIWDFLSKHQKQ